VPGVSNIETDVPTNTCKFYLADDKLDLKAKLDEFAKTNDHIAGWSMAEGG
jgi:hypothetical protein